MSSDISKILDSYFNFLLSFYCFTYFVFIIFYFIFHVYRIRALRSLTPVPEKRFLFCLHTSDSVACFHYYNRNRPSTAGKKDTPKKETK